MASSTVGILRDLRVPELGDLFDFEGELKHVEVVQT